ncbi:MAG: leucine-rich repeat protein [Ruminococcus sp.]|nr:leucine-rich repeat protein [Ruminococcus sp.]
MKLKNLSSVILAAMMAATSVPAASLIAPYSNLTAYAIEVEDESTYDNGVVAEGTCGENLKWTIYSQDEVCLAVSGYGEMPDWESFDDTPWAEYCDSVGVIRVECGVQNVSENAFSGIDAFLFVVDNPNCVIPDSETAIPECAEIWGYDESTALAYAEKYGRECDSIGTADEYHVAEGDFNGLEWILWSNGGLAFYGYGDIAAENGVYPWDRVADSIKTITINTSVRSIGENAFTKCTSLESVLMYTPDCKIADSADVFPSDVLLQVGADTTAEEYASKYNLSHDVYNFFTASGEIGDNLSWTLFNGGSLRIYGEGDMIDLGGVNPWGEYEDEITRVQINEEVTSIDKSAFEGCDNIAEMIVLNPECKFAESEDAIPEDTVIFGAEGSGALMYAQMFGRSFKTISSEITAPEEEESPFVAEGKCGETLDWNIQTDKRLFINGDGVMDSYMGYSNWEEYTDLFDTVEYSGKLENYGEYAFYNCKNLKSIELAPVIGAHAFEGCSNITSTITSGEFVLKEIGDYAFYGCDNLGGLTIKNPECVIADSPYVFPEDMTIFGVAGSTAQAHAEKYGLEFVDITETTFEMVAGGELGNNLYWNLWSSGVLNILGNGDMIEIDGVYPWDEYADQITNVYVREDVTSISAGAFDDCVNLSSADIRNRKCVIADVDNVFPANTVIHGYAGSTAQAYAEKYNMHFTAIRTEIVSGEFGEGFEWTIFDDNTILIDGVGKMPEYEAGNYPWSDYSDMIKEIQLGKEVESIGAYAFYNCTNLNHIQLAPVIGEHAYDGCINAYGVGYYSDIPVNEIGDYAFNNCGFFSYQFTNPECVIADSEFVFPANTVIHGYAGSTAQAYAEKYGLEFVEIESEEQGFIAYGELGENLTWKLLNDGMLYINGEGEMLECGEGGYPWSDFSDKIKDISLAKEVTSIGAYAFYNCTNLNQIQLAPVIGEHAYDGCINVYGVGSYSDIPVNEIGDYAFNNCGFFSYQFTNPDCVIADSEFVFPDGATIWGHIGSTAQAHAEKYGLDFEVIEGEPVTTTAPDSDSETTTTTSTTTPNDSESELPQTGFSKAYDYLAFSAGVMALCGIYAMKKGKKKEDEE